MWEDPIVGEVHRTREKLAAEYNFDVGASPTFGGVKLRRAGGSYRRKSNPKHRLRLTVGLTRLTDVDCALARR